MPDPVNVSRLQVDDWEHAFVTGNGRQGAACYGSPRALVVTLSHERLFLPVDRPLDPPHTAPALGRLRDLLYTRRFQQAADEVVALATAEDPRYRRLRQVDPFIGAATLTFIPDSGAGSGTGWRRTVDFATGVVSQRWSGGSQEVFVSRVHDLVVIRLRAREPISGRLHLGPIRGTPPVALRLDTGSTPRRLWLRATFPNRWPEALAGYSVTCELHLTGGTAGVEFGSTSVRVVGAAEILLLARTRPVPEVGAEEPGTPIAYADLLAAHAAVHRDLFERCRLDLDIGRGDQVPSAGRGLETRDRHDPDQPTESLIAQPTRALVRRLFDAGRYAIICASGELPPNLQGVWSGTFDPAWRGGYTLDGNLQTALAGVAPTGTPELLLPLFDLLDRHRDDFRRNAQRLYGLPGILVPPHLSTHGRHNHFTRRWCLTFWTGAAAWLARLYYDYWLFTGDREFLRERALPFMREAARFYTAFVTERDGVVHFAPSYSPENSPDDSATQACVSAAMDMALLRDLLTNLVNATATDPDLAVWRGTLARLPPYQIDGDGALAEWLWPRPHNNHGHRHASHLFGLWYEPDPAVLDDPVLRRGAVRSIRRRLGWWREQGDEMAFGLVQLGLAAAGLGLAEEAHEVLARLSTRYWRANLVSTHNAGSIFNTDICGGLPALVTAMLAGSRGDVVRLLPALPAAWPAGSIRGVLLRGGIRLDRLAWSPDLVEAELVCREDRELTVSVRDSVAATVAARSGRAVTVSFVRG